MKIMTILCLVLLLPIVLADTNVTVDVTTDEDVNFWANCYTNGSCNYWLDGSGYPDFVNQRVSETHYSVWNLVSHLEKTVRCMMGIESYCSEWHYRIGNALNAWFLPRIEYEQELRDTQIRIAILERTVELIDKEAYCRGKISIMRDYNLDWIMCENVTYYNVNGKGIAITGVE